MKVLNDSGLKQKIYVFCFFFTYFWVRNVGTASQGGSGSLSLMRLQSNHWQGPQLSEDLNEAGGGSLALSPRLRGCRLHLARANDPASPALISPITHEAVGSLVSAQPGLVVCSLPGKH